MTPIDASGSEKKPSSTDSEKKLTPSEIEKRALETLRSASALTAPVDVARVAESLGARVRYEQLEEKVSGVLIVKGDEKHIMINSAHPATRQRFTLAHEIGHLQLHNVQGRLFIDESLKVYQRVGASHSAVYQQPGSMTSPKEERQANIFASALLMPDALLKRAALDHDLFDELDVLSLANAFGVSEQAMSIRLQQLDLIAIPSAEDLESSFDELDG